MSMGLHQVYTGRHKARNGFQVDSRKKSRESPERKYWKDFQRHWDVKGLVTANP